MKKIFKIDFTGLGAAKSGTTWLANCLSEHPEICLPKKKELFFFNEYTYPLKRKAKNVKYHWGISWYKNFFKNCKQNTIKGEFTASYLYSKITAKRIYKHNPNIKLIAIFREPVKRAFSAYLYDERVGYSKYKSFEKAISVDPAYVEKSMYHKYLKEYFKIFPKKNIHIVLLDEVKINPKKTIKEVYKFLGLKNTNYQPPSLAKKSYIAASARFSTINYILRLLIYEVEKRELSFILKILDITNTRNFVWWLATEINKKPLKKYPKINPKTEKALRKKFQADIKKLEKLINKDLSAWK